MGSGVTMRPSGPRSTRLAPPNTAGATLSGWPSSSLQSSASSAGSSFSSSSAAAAAAPATVAAAEEPRPRATAMSESAASARPEGTSCPARRQAALKPRYSRSASGAVSRVRSVPPRSIATGATGFPVASRPARAVTRSQRPTATPTQSNPAPRLDVEPATRTVTLARIPGLFRETEKPAQCHAAGNHHDHFGCKLIHTARVRQGQGGSMAKIRVGILGATGAVGQRFLQLLDRHPQFTVTALAASDRSQGRPYVEACTWRLPGDPPSPAAALVVQAPEPPLACDLVFSGLPADVAGPIETRLAQAGYPVISNSSSHRMDDGVPLLVPEVNPDHLALLEARAGRGFIVTNPNCSTVMIALALAPLAARFGQAAVVVTTLQALSGAGYRGVTALDITDNVLPFIANEEEKIERETRKILGRLNGSRTEPAAFAVSAQCHRVNVVDGHLAAVRVKLGRPAEPAELRETLASFTALPQELRLPT